MDMGIGRCQNRGRGASTVLCLIMVVVVKTAVNVMQKESWPVHHVRVMDRFSAIFGSLSLG